MTEPTITTNEAPGTWVVRAAGAILGGSSNAVELHEGDYPAVIYFPRKDIAMASLAASSLKTTCPYKGEASYFSIEGEHVFLKDTVWSYKNPKPAVERIKDMLAFDLTKATVEQV